MSKRDVLMANPKWSAMVAMVMAAPGMEMLYDVPDVSESYPGADAYLSMHGSAGSALKSGQPDSWNAYDDTAEGMWFGSTYLEIPEGTVVGFVHVASMVSAGHLRDVIVALDDAMYREPHATMWPQSTCDSVGSAMRYVMWPDRIITKTVREKELSHREGGGFTRVE